MSTKLEHKRLKVVALEDGDTAEMLLYGVIGQQPSLYTGQEDEDLTDLAVVRKLKELEGKYSRIHIRINSPGGFVMDGDPIVNAIRNSKAEIHTYNDGLAASMAADIWLAGHKRHMAANAKLMIHNAWGIALGTAEEMRREAAVLDVYDQAAVANMVEITGMTEEEVREQFYNYQDHWMTRGEALQMGFVTEDEDKYEGKEMPEKIQRMSYRELLEYFAQPVPQEEKGFLSRLEDTITSALMKLAPQKIQEPQKPEEVDIQAFQTAITNGDIAIEEVIAYLQEQGYELSDPIEEDVIIQNKELHEQVQKVQQEFQTLAEQFQEFRTKMEEDLEKLAASPAAGPTQAAGADDPYEGLTEAQVEARKKYEEFVNQTTQAAKSGSALHVS